MVLAGFVTACRLAGCPTSRSPSLVNATMEGVVRIPSAFSIRRAVLPSMTATHEFVVPRSIPMTLPITKLLYSDFTLGIPPTLYASRQIWFLLKARGLAQRFVVKQGQRYSPIMVEHT